MCTESTEDVLGVIGCAISIAGLALRVFFFISLWEERFIWCTCGIGSPYLWRSSSNRSRWLAQPIWRLWTTKCSHYDAPLNVNDAEKEHLQESEYEG